MPHKDTCTNTTDSKLGKASACIDNWNWSVTDSSESLNRKMETTKTNSASLQGCQILELIPNY